MNANYMRWSQFRTALGHVIKERRGLLGYTSRYMTILHEAICDLNDEGPPICGRDSLHELYEGLFDYEADEDFSDVIHDWLINTHPGLCPAHIVREIQSLTGLFELSWDTLRSAQRKIIQEGN